MMGEVTSKRMEAFLQTNAFDKDALMKVSYAMYMQRLSQSSVSNCFICLWLQG